MKTVNAKPITKPIFYTKKGELIQTPLPKTIDRRA